MLLWIGFAILTAAVVAALVEPLRRKDAPPLDAAAADIAVYRDQLAEIEAERARGLFTEEEARGARVEVARRLIGRAEAGVDSAAQEASNAGRPVPSKTVLRIAAGLIPLASVGLYLAFGAPNLPGRPLAARHAGPLDQASVAELVAKVETRLREHPEDGQGWDVIAPVYLRLGRYADAAHAFSQASRILGETAGRLAGFGEASLLAGGGIVSEEVRRASERILALEPGRIEARLWLALAKEQDGDLKGAAADLSELLASAAPGAPWREAVTARIERLNRRPGGEAGPPAAPSEADGPSADDAARLARMSPPERARFIDRMVAGLADRLKREGNDLGGWLRLVRAYKVLGRDRDATAALAEARRHFDGDTRSLAELDALAQSLGLGS